MNDIFDALSPELTKSALILVGGGFLSLVAIIIKRAASEFEKTNDKLDENTKLNTSFSKNIVELEKRINEVTNKTQKSILDFREDIVRFKDTWVDDVASLSVEIQRMKSQIKDIGSVESLIETVEDANGRVIFLEESFKHNEKKVEEMERVLDMVHKRQDKTQEISDTHTRTIETALALAKKQREELSEITSLIKAAAAKRRHGS